MTSVRAAAADQPVAPLPPLANLGTLIVAHPDLFDDGSEPHLGAMRAVSRALANAGALAPRLEKASSSA